MEIIAEKRVRLTKPYKQLCSMWRKIAIGAFLVSCLLTWLLFMAVIGNNKFQYENQKLEQALDTKSTITIHPIRGK